MEILALEQLRDRVLGHETHEIIGGECTHPAAVEIDNRFVRIENLEYLRFVSFRVMLDLLAAEGRARCGAASGIADHASEVADQENCGVPEVLEVLEFAQ